MLAFITTLRHPHNSADYSRVETLLRDTLRSLERQTSDDHVVLIVGNRRPSFDLPERMHFVEVDFPPPSEFAGPQTGPAPVIWDKGTKTAIGLIAARAFAPEYVMCFDADDFVHRRVAEFAHDHPGRDGWAFRRGWIYSRRRNAYALRRKFYKFCGTSFIIPWEAYGVPAELTVRASQQEIAAGFGAKLENVLEHGFAFDWWQRHGRRLRSLPFPGAIYHVETGENHSGNHLYGPALPYRSHLRRDFGLLPSRGRWSTVWAAMGPRSWVDWPHLSLRPPAKPTSFLADFTPPTPAPKTSPE